MLFKEVYLEFALHLLAQNYVEEASNKMKVSSSRE